MSNDTVIKVENLSKQYRIGTHETGYRTFRDTLIDVAKAPFTKIANLFNPTSDIRHRNPSGPSKTSPLKSNAVKWSGSSAGTAPGRAHY